MNDPELLALLQKSESSAFEYLFKQKHTVLCALAHKIVQERDVSKDVVQEVFIKLWRNRHSLNITGSLDSYLKKATINTALNFIKSSKHAAKHEITESILPYFLTNATEEDLAYHELKIKADQAILGLPERTRIVFTLIRSEQLSYQEVAETMHISIKAVEKEMMKALRLLREALKEYLHNYLVIGLLTQLL